MPEYVRPGQQKAHCVTTGKPMLMENGVFIAQSSHTYRITVRR